MLSQTEKKVYQMLRKDFENVVISESQELFSSLNNMINNMCFHSNQFIETIINDGINNNNFDQLVGAWISVLLWQKQHHMWDGRNEYSVKLSSSIAQNSIVVDLMNDYGFTCLELDDYFSRFHNDDLNYKPVYKYIALRMANEHRTLQQTFSSIIFHYLYQFHNVKIDDYWADCPTI